MDFNTGSGPGESGRPQSSGDGPRRTSGVTTGGEFNYTDPAQSFTDTVRRLILEPVAFFRGMARQGDFVNPAIFALICYLVFTIIGGLLAMIGIAGDQGFGGFLLSIILAPIFLAIGLLIGAGIIHLLVVLIIGAGNAGFEGTFRVLSYASVTNLVTWIPFIGPILGLYALYLGVLGVREVHNTTTGKAAIVVLIPAAVILLLALMLVLVAGAALFFSTR